MVWLMLLIDYLDKKPLKGKKSFSWAVCFADRGLSRGTNSEIQGLCISPLVPLSGLGTSFNKLNLAPPEKMSRVSRCCLTSVSTSEDVWTFQKRWHGRDIGWPLPVIVWFHNGESIIDPILLLNHKGKERHVQSVELFAFLVLGYRLWSMVGESLFNSTQRPVVNDP